MEELLKKAAVIRDETEDNLNTAQRVGTLFVDILQAIQSIVSTHRAQLNSFKFSADKEAVKLSFKIVDALGNTGTKVISIPIVSATSAGVLSSKQLEVIQSNFSNLSKKIIELNTVIGSSDSSEAEDGSVWGKLITIIQDIASNSLNISNIESTINNRLLGIVDLANIDTLNNLKSLGHYHVYSGKKPMHELIVTSDNMYHTIIQYMFSNYTVKDGELSAHQDNIATIVYRVYNINAPGMTEIPRGTWSKWRQYGQNFEVLSETEYENLKRKDSEMFYYTYEEEEEV